MAFDILDPSFNLPPGVPWPDEDPAAWNTCKLGGFTLPGIAKVSVKAREKLDVKEPKGGHGAYITRDGYSPAPVSIDLMLWTPDQFREYQRIIRTLRPKVSNKDRKGEAQSIVHPKTIIYGITSVILQDIDDDDDDRGDSYKVKFACVEFFPPPPAQSATKTVTTSIGPFNNQFVTPPPTPPKPSTGPTPP